MSSVDDEAPGEQREPSAGAALPTIAPQPGQRLSKDELRFNATVARIAALEQAIANERQRLDRLLDLYDRRVAPCEAELAKQQAELAQAAAEAADRLGPEKRQKAVLRSMIVTLFEQASALWTLDAESRRIYQDWAGFEMDDGILEETERLRAEIPEDFAEALRDQFDAIRSAPSPEALARLAAEIRERARRSDEDAKARQNERHANAREPQPQRRKEAVTKKSVRDVYLELARTLHPDAVGSGADRAPREQAMKLAGQAYRAGDVVTLLRLRQQWTPSAAATRPGAAIAKLLRALSPALEAQRAQLEVTLRTQKDDPRYDPVSRVLDLSEQRATKEIERRARALRKELADTIRYTKALARCRTAPELANLASDYLDFVSTV